MKRSDVPKHAQVRATLRRDIRDGRWRQGDRLPSEAELGERFGVSRITISRAMRDLQSADLIERRRGSGTYVKRRRAVDGKSFGLLIPDLGESEVFAPICRGMMASPLAERHALIWGNSPPVGGSEGAGEDRDTAAWHLCQQFIERGVSGVFFAPIEHVAAMHEINHKIGRALDQARIPVVLLDRPLLPFPAPGRHDLVGIDNRHAGYIITDHLLRQGCRRIQFVARPGSAPTVDDREAGYREALFAWKAPYQPYFVHRIDPNDVDTVKALMEAARPDGIVCANDRTAGSLMRSLRRLEYRIPEDVRLTGIDDVEYASLLPVPLTTLRQPTRQIGFTALAMMLERIARPDLPVRDVRLQCELVIRESCGAGGRPAGAAT